MRNDKKNKPQKSLENSNRCREFQKNVLQINEIDADQKNSLNDERMDTMLKSQRKYCSKLQKEEKLEQATKQLM